MCQWYHYQIFRYFSSLIEILLHKRFVTNSLRLNINLSIIAKWSNDLLLLSCLYPQRRNAKQNPSKILFYNTFNFLMYKKFSSLHFRHAQSINKMSFALKIFVWFPLLPANDKSQCYQDENLWFASLLHLSFTFWADILTN